jgi:hypothetical protein
MASVQWTTTGHVQHLPSIVAIKGVETITQPVVRGINHPVYNSINQAASQDPLLANQTPFIMTDGKLII